MIMKTEITNNEIIKITKDYKVIDANIGKGSFGQASLLEDCQIKERFVLKKYSPKQESIRKEFFNAFKKEIKVLYKIYHKNIVRIFNYYFSEEESTGFIIMEYIDGFNIDDYLENKHSIGQAEIDKIFIELISAFNYLEKKEIMHRDIRIGNIMIDNNGNVKIIDFGLAKTRKTTVYSNNTDTYCNEINHSDMDVKPEEFNTGTYTHKTDMLCLAELLYRLIKKHNIKNFSYSKTLNKMMEVKPINRYKSFEEIMNLIDSKEFESINVSYDDRLIYCAFAGAIHSLIGNYKSEPIFKTDVSVFINSLNDVLDINSFEFNINNNVTLIRLFLSSDFTFNPAKDISVDIVRNFRDWFTALGRKTQDVVIRNIIIKLKTIEIDEGLPF